jgi:hypothetical protein
MPTRFAPQPSHRRAPRTFAEITDCHVPKELARFVIPEMQHDLEKGVCLTVRLARGSDDPFVAKIYNSARRFFREASRLAALADGGDDFARRKLERMLFFPEVPEIRFGYTREGHDGRGIGRGDLSHQVLQYYRQFHQLRAALIDEPDVLQMVPLIGMDRVSDAVATICKRELILFTQECARYYGFDPTCIQEVPVSRVWDHDEEKIVVRSERLPVDDAGKPIILVPKEIVRSGEALGAADYFRDIDPDGKRPKGKGGKAAALTDAEKHPGRLTKYASAALKDAKPRRDLFPKPDRKKK